MAWVWLIIAGLFEVCWATGLKYTEHFSRLWPTVWVLVTMFLSILFLEWALRTIPIGTGYAAWTGIGVLGTVIFGVAVFGEAVSVPRIVFTLMIVGGIVGLKLTTGH